MARSIRDYTDSEKVNALSWQAECLFARLLLKADDYGSFHASPQLLISFLFPLKSHTLRAHDVALWIEELIQTGLVLRYLADGKTYVRIMNYNQRLTHGLKAKFPHPPEIEVEGETEVERENRSGKTPARVPDEQEFLDYCRGLLPDYAGYEFSLKAKYASWVDLGWKTGHGKPIKNWKTTIQNTIPHLKKMPVANKHTTKIEKSLSANEIVKNSFTDEPTGTHD